MPPFRADRGIEVGSPVASWWLWQAIARVNDAGVYYDQAISAFQVRGAGVAEVAGVMNLLLVGSLLFSLGSGWLASRRGAAANQVLATTALCAVLDLICFDKVGSPQYTGWLVIPVMLGFIVRADPWRVPAIAGVLLAGLTGLTYPVLFDGILASRAFPTVVLTLRNLMLVGLLVWAHVRLFRIGTAQGMLQQP